MKNNLWCSWLVLFLLVPFLEGKRQKAKDEEEYEDICPFPWQTHEQNILSQYSQCNEFENEGVRCTLHDPIECTGRNPICVFSKHTGDYRCCSDVPQDLSNPPGIPEQVKPICPYGASSYDIPSVMLCDPTEENACPEDYTCEQAVNHQMLTTYNMHLCCKTTTLDSFENVFYETKVGINKMSSNLSMPVFYVTSLSPSIIPVAPSSGVDYIVLNEFIASKGPLPEIRTGDHFSMLPYKLREPTYLSKVVLLHEQFPGYYHHVLLLFNPHGNPESMNLYYNRPSSLSREIELSVPAWDEGVFFRNINRVLTIQNDQTSTKTTRKLYIVLVFKTKVPLTRRHPQMWHDLHANYTSFTEFLATETGKFLGNPVAGSYFYKSSEIQQIYYQLPILEDCRCDFKSKSHNLCYHSPTPPFHATKRSFNCSHLGILNELDLLSSSENTVVGKGNFDDELSQMISAISEDHQHEAIIMLIHIRRVWPRRKVIIYDLGLSNRTKKEFNTFCHLEIRNFSFDKFPNYVRNLKEYRWKPLIIAMALKEFSSIWYMDSSVRWLTRIQERSLKDHNQQRILLFSPTIHGIYPATHKEMYSYFKTDLMKIKEVRQFEANFALISKTPNSIEIIKWWTLCALEKDCMAPSGAELECNFEGEELAAEPTCHRFDQSALNILLSNAHNYDMAGYVYRTGLFGHFFKIERSSELRHSEKVSLQNCRK